MYDLVLSTLHKVYAVVLGVRSEQTLDLTLSEDTFVNQRDPARRLGPDGLPAVSRR